MIPFEKLLLSSINSFGENKIKNNHSSRMKLATSSFFGNSRGRTVAIQVNDLKSQKKKVHKINQNFWTSILDNPNKENTVSTQVNKTKNLQRSSQIYVVSIPSQDSPKLSKYLEDDLPEADSFHSTLPRLPEDNSDGKSFSLSSAKSSLTERPLNYQFEIVKKHSSHQNINSKTNKLKIKKNLKIENCSHFEIVNDQSLNTMKINENLLMPYLENLFINQRKNFNLSKFSNDYTLHNLQETKSNPLSKSLLNSDKNDNCHQLEENSVTLTNNTNEVTANMSISIENNSKSETTQITDDINSKISSNPEVHLENISKDSTENSKLTNMPQDKGDCKKIADSLWEAINNLSFQELVQLFPLVALRLDLKPNFTKAQKLKIFRKILKILTGALATTDKA